MAQAQKRVIVRRFSFGFLPGFMAAKGFVRDGSLEVLDTGGTVQRIPLDDVKMACFVRDFGVPGQPDPEKLGKRLFTVRPRAAGLVVRVRFTDEDLMEGLAANDASLLEHDGLLLTPPDTRSNTQRVFIPRCAVAELEVTAVIRPPRRREAHLSQQDLFDAHNPNSGRIQ